MGDLKITRTTPGDVIPGRSYVFEVRGGTDGEDFVWRLDGHEQQRKRDRAWTLDVPATAAGGAHTVRVEQEGSDHADAPVTYESAERAAVYHPGFAKWVAIWLAGFAVLLVAVVAVPLGRFSWTVLLAEEAAAAPVALAAVLGLALTAVGVVVLLCGAWLTLVESRGRMVDAEPAARSAQGRGLFDVAKLAEAVAKLKGAGLLVFAGLALLLAVAWIAVNAVGAEPASEETPAPATSEPAEPTEPSE